MIIVATTITTTGGWLTATTDDWLATSPTGVVDCTAAAVTGTAVATASV